MNIASETLFRALVDPTRLRCIVLLVREGELCVCELTHALGVAQPKISRHLAQLREVGLVEDRRAGLWIYYRLHPHLPAWITDVIVATVAGVAEQTPFVDDRVALAGMPNRPGVDCCV